MKDESKTKRQLISELVELREQIAHIKESEEDFKKLKESNEKFVKAFRQSSVFMALTTLKEGRYVDVNNVFLKFIGMKRDEVIGRTSREIGYITEEQRAELLNELKTKGCVENLELQVRTKNGQIRYGLFSTVMMTIDNEKYLLTDVVDITDRKAMEKTLKESEERFRSLVEATSDWIWETDAKGIYTYSSPRVKDILGYEPSEVLGKSPLELMPDDEAKRVGGIMFKNFEKPRPFMCFENLNIHKDGHTVILETSGVPVLDENGNLTGYRGIDRDITEKKDLEAQLLQMQKMDAISMLTAGIAHNFNNLLLVIQEYASLMLLDTGSSHPHYRYLKTIEEQVAIGADLTRQMTSFARNEKSAVTPAKINEIIQRTSSMFWGTKKEIAVCQELEKNIWELEVDHGQIEQLFINLYMNAWQAMPDGGKIFISTENITLNEDHAYRDLITAGKYIKILIADTGIGMDKITRERIFDPYFTTKEKGTGLGLVTVYNIVKGHRGMINVSSRPGRGTEFSIYLPASGKEPGQQKAAEVSVPKGEEAILLVDDEQPVLDATKELLGHLGYRVYVALNGHEAIAVYREKRKKIDLVILDVTMPGISGGEIFDRLREVSPEVRVLLASGYGINGEVQKILDRGCNGFLSKPFRLKELARNVRKILD